MINHARNIMKIAANIAAGLLGFLFVAFSLMVLLHLVSPPPPPAGSPVASFLDAFVPTGYMTFVKIFELIGGILVVIPKVRNLGLLILGPIVLNILAFHIFVAEGEGLVGIPLFIAVLALFVLWTERRSFAGLIH
jgi:putative oxidoreductase